MKILLPVFLILAIVLFLGSLSVFIAGTLIFLSMRAYYEIAAYSGAGIAFFSVLIGSILFVYVAFALIRDWISFKIKKKLKEQGKKGGILGLIASNKLLISITLLEILKLFLRKKKKFFFRK